MHSAPRVLNSSRTTTSMAGTDQQRAGSSPSLHPSLTKSKQQNKSQSQNQSHWRWSRPLALVNMRAFKKRQRADSGHDASSIKTPSSSRNPSFHLCLQPSVPEPSASPSLARPPAHRGCHTLEVMEDDRPSATDSRSMLDVRSFRSAYSATHSRFTPSLGSNMSVRLQHFHIGTPGLHHRFRRRLSCSTTFSSSSTSTTSGISHSQSHSHSHWSTNRGGPSPARHPRSASVHSGTSAVTQAWSQRRAQLLSVDQSLPDFETQVYCPTCQKWVQSRIRYRLGALVWLVAFILFMCTVILFWVPFYVKYFKDVVHYCPGCGTWIGRHTKL